jgi:Tellurite resistance protein TehB.
VPDPAPSRTAPDDWSEYYRYTAGRQPRPLFLKGMAAVTAAGLVPGQAVEIGFGDGTESLALLQDGWRVTAIDPTPSAATILLDKAPVELHERLEIVASRAEGAELPDFDFLYAGYALSFIHPDRFPGVWATIRERMRPGGVLAVNVFGIHDTWAQDPGMTFVDRDAAMALVEGLELFAIDEEDADGPSGSGPKHWHLFDLVARRPSPSDR